VPSSDVVYGLKTVPHTSVTLSNLTGEQIARTVNQYYRQFWQEALHTKGMRDYFDNEPIFDSSFTTSVVRLAIIAASQYLGFGALNEHRYVSPQGDVRKIDVIWRSTPPTPSKPNQKARDIDSKEIILLAEIEMAGNVKQAVERLREYDQMLRSQGLQELWKLIVTYVPANEIRPILSALPSGDFKWLIITDDPQGRGAEFFGEPGNPGQILPW